LLFSQFNIGSQTQNLQDMKFYPALFCYKQHCRTWRESAFFRFFCFHKKDVPEWPTSAYCHT